MGDGKIVPQSGKFFASASERTQNWNGIQQEITGRVQRKLAYEVTAIVRIFGNNVTNSDVRATLWVQTPNKRDQYIGISRLVFLSFSFIYISVPCYLRNCLVEILVWCDKVCRQQTRTGHSCRESSF